MSKFSIVSTCYMDYYLLRQFVESILTNVPPDTYEEVIIIDDYSATNGKLREYQKFVNENYPKFKVYYENEHRFARHFREEMFKNKVINDVFDYRKYDSDQPNRGVVRSIHLGLTKVQTPYVIVLDSDNVFLQKSNILFPKMELLFEQHPKVMAMGELVYFARDDVWVCEGPQEVLHPRTTEPTHMAGRVSPMCLAARMSGWWDEDIWPIIPHDDRKLGHGYKFYFVDLWVKGFYTCNFPTYKGKYIFHLGGGTSRENIRETKHALGFTKFGDKYYGGRRGGDKVYSYYSGAYKINLTDDEYIQFLKNSYDNTPYGDIQPLFDEELLIPLTLDKTAAKHIGPTPVSTINRWRDETMAELWDRDVTWKIKKPTQII